MANSFTITTPAQTLKTDVNGHTTTVFTVTNTTSRPLRGIAKIKPLGNTEATWIKIEGETERDFPAGGTHQFTVNFTKPKPPTLPHPAESFRFRLDAISAENPDEDFTEGPTVTVEIPEQKEETKKFPWWILIVIGVLLIIGVVVAILLLRSGGNSSLMPTPTPTATPTATPATPTPTPTPTGISVIYDFYDNAASAKWINDSSIALPFNGPTDWSGSVKAFNTAALESDTTESKILETHPKWQVGGRITGTYTLLQPIDVNDRFRAKIGFMKAFGSQANVKVRLLLNGLIIAEVPKAYDGTLSELKIDLKDYEGEIGNISLQVVTDSEPDKTWICWINPRIERVQE